MNLFTFSSIIFFVVISLLAVIVFIKSRYRKLNIIWGCFCICGTIWGAACYKFSTTSSYANAFFWWQIAYIGVILAPLLYSHFVYEFLKLKINILLYLYLFTFIFLSLNFFKKELFLGDLRFVFNQFYCVDWTKYHSPIFLFFYISYYWILLLNTMFLLLKQYKFSAGLTRRQLKFLILGSILGWLGPHSFFLVSFGFNIYPPINFLLSIFAICVSYAIFRHHFLDVDIVIKKGLVYSVLVAIITAGYLIFVIAIGRIFQGLVGYQSFFVNLVAIFTIAILFNPLRNRIQRFLDKQFFKGTLESLAEEREKLRQELFQTEKLAYIGGLASSVAHEIKNPLTTIKTFLEYLPQRYQEPDFKKKIENLLPKEIERIENVVSQLLDLAKPRQPVFREINIVNVIDSTLALLENNLKTKSINVKKYYQIEEAIIQGDEEQLRQVFLNLFLNSIQAMNDGGSLEVAVNLCSSVSKSLSAGQAGVSICVKDTGCGISEENLKKLFTPFFTTKKDGVGLGLVITQEIINNHKGTMSVQGKVGEGTSFIIKLPIII